ncbi:PIN domain-containing protein [Candidatus Woesearchaeota archaeon]|jgi:predicted nucleic acid-binding protein|nr:PIN domain-containing protein [Candidatus Woesearchaeota archaeon]
MKTKYYIDTCIWRDYFENRKDRFRPLGEWALFLLNMIIDDNNSILYSNLVLDELRKEYNEETISNLFEPYKNCLIKVGMSRQQMLEATRRSRLINIPFADALHAILARDNSAILITRDKHLFELQNMVEIRTPEDLF